MLTVYKDQDGKLQKTEELQSQCWIRVVNPSPEEISTLCQRYSIPTNFISDSLDVHERARVETEDGIRLILMRVPVFEEHLDVEYTTIPLGIIIANDVVITVSSRETDTIQPFVLGKVKNLCLEKKNRFVLQIAYQASKLYLTYLERINFKTNALEEELHKSLKNEALVKLLNLEKSLVFFTTSLRSNELMLERLQKQEAKNFIEDDVDLLDDVVIETRQAIEMANIYSNILSGLMDAFASIISNNLNIVMKFLTAATIILMIPNLIASIYGMNIGLPLQENPMVFMFIIVLSVWLSLVTVVVFLRRNFI
ncbi:MAG: magnesium transporter CorA family protein [Thermoplasmata archaeon]|nr:magnesium transporter CorA family protein [Thermoplasmata archaeon]